jgi:hypothetical protein
MVVGVQSDPYAAFLCEGNWPAMLVGHETMEYVFVRW